jgi:serine protease Do
MIRKRAAGSTGQREQERMSVRIATLTVAVMALAALCGPRAGAAALSPGELLQLAQQSTFEVVLPKIEPDYVHYEKPLPLELLSYRERTDKFWSIGTAFAIAPDTYVSAAHVLLSGLGSPMGQPLLRDADGKTYPVEQVLKFSLHEDYIVFRARGATAARVLQPNREPHTGSSVYAVGNALGDGVVVRDGLLTSLTPEDQDGRWKWLRFSAAASPGNSGGPLLDSEGHVLGIVTMKSPGENLNYALPVARMLDGQAAATFDVRSSFGVPILRQQMVTQFKDSFALPAKWSDFAHEIIARGDREYDVNQKKLLAEHAGELPPNGNVAKLLGVLNRNVALGLIHQQEDDSWDISAPEHEEETMLPDGASLWTGSVTGAYTFRLVRLARQSDAVVYHDDVAFMDAVLKGIKLPRAVGTQAIRITSLGKPQQQELHTDRFGRIWQVRSWSLGYTDLQLLTITLPTPDGYAGLLQATQAAGYHDTLARLLLLADYTHVQYRGSPAQWQTLTAETKLCPPFLRDVQFRSGAPVRAQLRNMDALVPASLLPIDAESLLSVFVRYTPAAQGIRADPDGITIEVRPDGDSSWVGIWAQPHPAVAAGKELTDRWNKMRSHQGDYDGLPHHSPDFRNYWTKTVLGDVNDELLYEVSLTLFEKSLVPRQVSDRREQLLGGLKLKADHQ